MITATASTARAIARAINAALRKHPARYVYTIQPAPALLTNARICAARTRKDTVQVRRLHDGRWLTITAAESLRIFDSL